MRLGTTVFRVALVAGWLFVLALSVRAVSQMGFGPAGTVYFGDFSHPWRAQFNGDFGMHLLLVAAWMVYRTKGLLLGLLCGLLAINLGGVFTLAYLLVVSIRAKGDMRQVLLGARAGGQPIQA